MCGDMEIIALSLGSHRTIVSRDASEKPLVLQDFQNQRCWLPSIFDVSEDL